MKIFSGTSNKPLAEKLAKNLGQKLSDLEVFVFPDGERRVRILENVVDEDVFVVQSTGSPADSYYMELFFIIDGLKRSGAKSITAIVPYLGYQRQDHVFRTGEAVSLQVVINILENLGINEIIVLDLHSIKIKEDFKVPAIHLSALSLFAEFIKEKGMDKNSTTLISPDMGGIRRIKILSEMLDNMPYAVIEKDRDLASGNVEASKIHGKVSEKAIIVDDMISSGKTIVIAGELLKKMGVKNIDVFVTHPIFSEKAPEILQKSEVSSVNVTDTVFVPKDKHFAKLNILSVSTLIAENIKSS